MIQDKTRRLELPTKKKCTIIIPLFNNISNWCALHKYLYLKLGQKKKKEEKKEKKIHS